MRHLNFQLHDLSDETVRDHFREVDEANEEQKVGNLFFFFYAIFTDVFEIDASTTVSKRLPGNAVLLSGRVQVPAGTWRQIPSDLQAVATNLCYFSALETGEETYRVVNVFTSPVICKIFAIYERP